MPKPRSFCVLVAISVSVAMGSEAAAGRRGNRGGTSCGAQYGSYDGCGGSSWSGDGCAVDGFTADGSGGSGCGASGMEEPCHGNWSDYTAVGCDGEVLPEMAHPQYEGEGVPALNASPEMSMPSAVPQYPQDPQAKASPNYELRHWVDRSGTYSRVARLLLASRDRARLIAPDGSCYDIQLSRLSPADASYVSGLAADGNAVLNVPGFGPAVIAPALRRWSDVAGSPVGRLIYSDPHQIQMAAEGGQIHTVSRDKFGVDDAQYIAIGESAAPTLATSARRLRY